MKTTVASSLIAAIEYDAETQELIVHWVKGGQYAYQNVPKEVHDAFVASDSVGRYYNQNIKGNAAYAGPPVSPPEEF